MPIHYKAVERTNPTKPSEPKKFYATVTGRQPVDLKTIAQSISDTSTTVSHVDVYAVLIALTDKNPAPAAEWREHSPGRPWLFPYHPAI